MGVTAYANTHCSLDRYTDYVHHATPLATAPPRAAWFARVGKAREEIHVVPCAQLTCLTSPAIRSASGCHRPRSRSPFPRPLHRPRPPRYTPNHRTPARGMVRMGREGSGRVHVVPCVQLTCLTSLTPHAARGPAVHPNAPQRWALGPTNQPNVGGLVKGPVHVVPCAPLAAPASVGLVGGIRVPRW